MTSWAEQGYRQGAPPAPPAPEPPLSILLMSILGVPSRKNLEFGRKF